jgi:hypothetical protein
MSSNILGNVGSGALAVGGAYFGGPLGGLIGRAVGGFAANEVGNLLNDPKVLKGNVGQHLADLAVQGSGYGKMIPVVYGYGRLAGNIIWALPIQQVTTVTQSNSGGGKGTNGKQATTKSDTQYSYFITLAIAICEGEIDEFVNIWADSQLLNQANYSFRYYYGTQTQTPDSLIESYMGVGKTPAYRGMAYIVMENFPIAAYGNRIPNFTFEVKKTVNIATSEETPVEELISAMVLIPGAGEFVYDNVVQSKIQGELVGGNWAQVGNIKRVNQNNASGKADALVALDQLAKTCPNVRWVSVVVCWFGDSIDAGTCVIKPGVEYQTGAITSPDVWSAGGFTRATARQITLIGGNPQYGGTPSDASLLRYLTELKSRGYKIMFDPLVFMDVANKPWRGRITGSASSIANFFTKTNGYNAFIIYYANLVKNYVDAFMIGSEMIGLTSVNNGSNIFPGVSELVSLAATVKSIVGANVKVTYGADWSEYHHTSGGWYNMDPLWASPNIDMVGIDAYFPLTDEQEPAAGFTKQQIMDGWTSGEGYDWYYSDVNRTVKTQLTAEFAWKNLAWWWNNTHVNPNSVATAWIPASKKIWFTEYGFPSVDGSTNQPNVFYDPRSSESHFPYHSRGRVDFRAQRNALAATESKWAESNMVERKFLWTWDARPFPFWPDLINVWADGDLWQYGHWVQGKLGVSSLAAIVAELCGRAGLDESQIDASRLTSTVDGYIIKNQVTVRSAIETLTKAYFFDAVESSGQVKYISRNGSAAFAISESALVPVGKDKQTIDIARLQEFELPQNINVVYISQESNYQGAAQGSQRLAVNSNIKQTISLPIVMSEQFAKIVADISLYKAWLERSQYTFTLPFKYAALEPTDIISVTINGYVHNVRVETTKLVAPAVLKITALADDASVYDCYSAPAAISPQTVAVADPGATILYILDLPAMPADSTSAQGYLRYAVCGVEKAWDGAVIFQSSDAGDNYNQLISVPGASVIGTATNILGAGVTDIFDYANNLTVNLYGSGTLESLSQLAVLNGANMAKIGDEIIQFQTATLVAEGKYSLSGLLRGRLGTEAAIGGHTSGEPFILIDNNIVKEIGPNSLIGIAKLYKAVSVGENITDSSAQSFAYKAVALRPFSPVSIAGARDGSGNLTITWIRRTRTNGQWQDNVDVPIGEAFEAYEVDIMNGNSVVRTISNLTSPTANYSAANQIIDFGSIKSIININVYQLSDIVGRGTAAIAIV